MLPMKWTQKEWRSTACRSNRSAPSTRTKEIPLKNARRQLIVISRSEVKVPMSPARSAGRAPAVASIPHHRHYRQNRRCFFCFFLLFPLFFGVLYGWVGAPPGHRGRFKKKYRILTSSHKGWTQRRGEQQQREAPKALIRPTTTRKRKSNCK